ncbi:MAG: epoxyqueuosine reductase QueH [Patescibacteria group bacterium]
MSKPKLLLHTCCACCGAWIPEVLSEDFEVDLFYFNPNVHPKSEYQHRLAEVHKIAEIHGLKLIEQEYDPEAWLKAVSGLENEKEGGARCSVCFEYRLRRAAKYARDNGYDVFTTTITVGRNKKADVINSIGEKLSEEFGVEFLARDFKKNAGLDTSVEKCKIYGIDRQDYCGCVFSRKEAYQRRLLAQ